MITKKGRQFKAVCFAIEGMSSFSVSFYSYYLYFLMQQQFGFGDKNNLALAASLGFITSSPRGRPGALPNGAATSPH
jgi:hypothetical protein